jgi:hypothetical protein
MTITRRFVIKTLGLLPFTFIYRDKPQAAIPPEVSGRRYVLNRFTVAGLAYYEGPDLVGGKDGQPLTVGTRLNLTAEPDNPHDPYAVIIECHGHKIGYVPRSDNHHLSRLLRQGAALECHAIDVDPDSWAWKMVRVEVGLVG